MTLQTIWLLNNRKYSPLVVADQRLPCALETNRDLVLDSAGWSEAMIRPGGYHQTAAGPLRKTEGAQISFDDKEQELRL